MAKDDGPWLDESEQRAWVRLVMLLMRLPLELDRQLLRDSDLSFFEYCVLSGLSEQPERSLRMSELAAFTGAQAPRLSQVVGRMEARGWVERHPDPDDRRSTITTLTDDGYAVLAAAAEGHVAQVRALVLDPLSQAQVQQLGSIAGRIVTTIIPDVPLPGPAR